MVKPKVTIIDGNNEIELSTIEDNVKAFMVKGEPGTDAISPTITAERDGKVTTLTIVDKNGTQEADINDGFDPTVTVTKEDRVTTVTATDVNGTTEVEIPDGIDLTGGVPTNGVIGFDVTELIYTCDGTETGDYYLTYDGTDYYFTMPTVEDGDILVFNIDDLELSLDGTIINTSSSGTGTELIFIDNLPNGYEETDETFPGSGSSITVHDSYSTSTTEPYSANYVNNHGGGGSITVHDSYSTSTTEPYSANYVNNAIQDVYSTSEIKTNKVWIDNKPIYRKVISISNITNTTGDNFISTGITNLETCISLDGIFNVGVNRIPINFHNSVSAGGAYSFCCFYHYSNNQIDILCKTAINSGYVIMEYTKAS